MIHCALSSYVSIFSSVLTNYLIKGSSSRRQNVKTSLSGISVIRGKITSGLGQVKTDFITISSSTSYFNLLIQLIDLIWFYSEVHQEIRFQEFIDNSDHGNHFRSSRFQNSNKINRF